MAPLLDVGDIAIIKKYKEFFNKKTYLLKIKGGHYLVAFIQTAHFYCENDIFQLRSVRGP